MSNPDQVGNPDLFLLLQDDIRCMDACCNAVVRLSSRQFAET